METLHDTAEKILRRMEPTVRTRCLLQELPCMDDAQIVEAFDDLGIQLDADAVVC